MGRKRLSDHPTPDIDMVDRIIASVALPQSGIDKQRLCHDLSCMQWDYYFGKDLRTNPAKHRKDRENRLRAARRLLDIVAPWEPIHSALESFVADVEREPQQFDRANGLIGGMSLFEWFVGVRLAICFEHHYKAKPSITQVPDTNIFKGDFLEFAGLVLDELEVTNNGQPYARGSIAAALWKIRKLSPSPHTFLPEADAHEV